VNAIRRVSDLGGFKPRQGPPLSATRLVTYDQRQLYRIFVAPIVETPECPKLQRIVSHRGALILAKVRRIRNLDLILQGWLHGVVTNTAMCYSRQPLPRSYIPGWQSVPWKGLAQHASLDHCGITAIDPIISGAGLLNFS
jgi:hypothetical protein